VVDKMSPFPNILHPTSGFGVDPFFQKQVCDRCRKKLDGRIMSWFTNETICLECSEKEDKIKEKMRKKGMNPNEYEGCGYIPKV